jgi:hypothetical protein
VVFALKHKNAKYSRKGTKKNANMQVKPAIFEKKDNQRL